MSDTGIETTAAPSQLDDPRLNELESQVLAKFQADTDEPQGYAALIGSAQEPVPVVDETPDPTPPDSTPPVPTHPADPANVPDPAPVTSAPPEVDLPDPAGLQDPAVPDLSDLDASDDGVPDGAQPWDTWDDDMKATGYRVTEWVMGLDDNSMQQIDAVLSGNYALVPIEDIPKITEYYQGLQNPQNPAAPVAPVASAQAPVYDDPYTDDLYADDPRYAAMAQQVAALQSQVQAQDERSLQAQQRDEINSGAATWFGMQQDLTPADVARLEQTVARSGLYQGYAASMSPGQAVQAALNAAIAQDQIIMSRRQDAIITARLQEERAAQAATAAQAQRQSAISGTGASGASAPPPASLDPDAGMRAMFEQAMYGNQG